MVRLPFDRRRPGTRTDEPTAPAPETDAAEAPASTPDPEPPEPPRWGRWTADILPGYRARTLAMPGVPLLAEEGPGCLAATLVRRGRRHHDRAVLYVHGWNDYFFQTHVADRWDALGYDFYALDLRRYGRSLHPNELPGYVADLADYDVELDAAVAHLRRHHRTVVVNAHSTGGLVASLWAGRHPGLVAGLVLNSPWIELQGSALMRAIAAPLVRSLASRRATWAIPVKESSVYFRTVHASVGGEWDYDLVLKRNPSNPVRPGWLQAILAGQDQVAAGLGIDVPVLMVTSSSSDFRRRWHPSLRSVDVVLDVDRLAARAPMLGSHVTLVRLDGAMHDVALSAEPVRGRYFDTIERWERAWLR